MLLLLIGAFMLGTDVAYLYPTDTYHPKVHDIVIDIVGIALGLLVLRFSVRDGKDLST